mgnify:CR=1 FL=1
MQTSIVYEFALIAPYLHLLPTNFSSHLLYYLNCSSQNHFVHLCVNIIHRPVTKHTPEWRVTCTGNGMSTETRARELLRVTEDTWDCSRVAWHVSSVSRVNTGLFVERLASHNLIRAGIIINKWFYQIQRYTLCVNISSGFTFLTA